MLSPHPTAFFKDFFLAVAVDNPQYLHIFTDVPENIDVSACQIKLMKPENVLVRISGFFLFWAYYTYCTYVHLREGINLRVYEKRIWRNWTF